MKRLAILCCLLAIKIQLLAQGYIVPNGVVINFNGLFTANEIDVLHNPADPTSGGSYTGFILNPIGKTQPTVYTNTFSFGIVVDVGVRVFFASSNDPISLQPILSGSYTELGGATSYVFANGVPFYLGLYTGNVQNAPSNGIYNDPLFGWVELVNNQGTVQILGSALEYQGGGIIAGTQTIIQSTPEPSSLALTALGTLLLGFCRRSKCG